MLVWGLAGKWGLSVAPSASSQVLAPRRGGHQAQQGGQHWACSGGWAGVQSEGGLHHCGCGGGTRGGPGPASAPGEAGQ